MSKVLVADDEKEVVEVISLYLEKDGFTVLGAHDGITALGIATTEKLDCAILDVMMPELNGFQLLKKIREKSNIPVIMLRQPALPLLTKFWGLIWARTIMLQSPLIRLNFARALRQIFGDIREKKAELTAECRF